MLCFALLLVVALVGFQQIAVAGGPSALTLSLEPPSGCVRAGDTVTFTCTAPGPEPPIKFHLYQVGKQRMMNISVKSLRGMFQFKVLSSSDGGLYFCVYDTEHFASMAYSNDVRVTVKAPAGVPKPKLCVTPSSGNAAVGDTVRLTCTAPGPDPPTHFVLYKDTENPRLTQAAGNSSVAAFEIKGVTVSDSGNYFCGYRINQTVQSLYSGRVQVTVTGLLWPMAVGCRLGIVLLLHLVVLSVWCWRPGDRKHLKMDGIEVKMDVLTSTEPN